jgi:hypothetical protein
VIPLSMQIPWKLTHHNMVKSNFYVRKPNVLEPRRVFTGCNQHQNHFTNTVNCPTSHQFSYNLFPHRSPRPPAHPPPHILRTSVRPGGEPGRTLYCSRSLLGPTAHTHHKQILTNGKHTDFHTSQEDMSQHLTCKGKGKGNNRYTTHSIGDHLDQSGSRIYQCIAKVE